MKADKTQQAIIAVSTINAICFFYYNLARNLQPDRIIYNVGFKCIFDRYNELWYAGSLD